MAISRFVPWVIVLRPLLNRQERTKVTKCRTLSAKGESLGTTSTSCAAEPLRILIVDDFKPLRETLRRLFDEFSTFAVVGEAVDGISAIEMALSLFPQVIIMDVRMPRLGGVEATRRIKSVLPQIHVIGLSSQDDPSTKEAMRAAGSSAFLPKHYAHTLPDVIAGITGRRVTDDIFPDGNAKRS